MLKLVEHIIGLIILKKLKKKNRFKSYPSGTLLLRDFNPCDGGHVGIFLRKIKKVYYFVYYIP